MTEPAGLERGYRRLLAWYPRSFRTEHEDEMLAVLLAGARQGQRRPGLLESANLIRSALGMRLWPAGRGPVNRDWADALTVFSVTAPLFLLVADTLQVALPYRLPAITRSTLLAHFLARAFAGHPEIGGLSLLRVHFFVIAVGCQVIVAALVLLGLRWLALLSIIASAVYWSAASRWVPWIPYPLQLLTAAVYILVAAALIASPGPRHGRRLMNWRHGVVLLVAAAAFQAAALRYDAMNHILRFLALRRPDTTVHLVISVVFAAVAVGLTVVWRLNRYFLLLLAAMFYPCAMQLAFSSASTSADLLGHPTPGHLVLLFLAPLLLAGWALLSAVVPRRSRLLLPSGPGQPGRA